LVRSRENHWLLHCLLILLERIHQTRHHSINIFHEKHSNLKTNFTISAISSMSIYFKRLNLPFRAQNALSMHIRIELWMKLYLFCSTVRFPKSLEGVISHPLKPLAASPIRCVLPGNIISLFSDVLINKGEFF
jgi:hypothetical protein